MCAILAIVSSKPDWNLVHQLLLESSARGLHATGVSFLREGKIVTVSKAVSASEFILSFPLEQCADVDGSLKAIFHCRYSTSDLEYNQPLVSKEGDKAIVHNGVVCQSSPEEWRERYGVQCFGGNDSELLLHVREPLTFFPDASIAACELRSDGSLICYRNGKRPAWVSNGDNLTAVTSTRDIASRCGLSARRLLSGEIYSLDTNRSLDLPNFPELIPYD